MNEGRENWACDRHRRTKAIESTGRTNFEFEFEI